MKAAVNLVSSSKGEGQNKPLVCLIPGGPGFSSLTLRSMEVLSRSFDLGFVDPPGTGNQRIGDQPNFEKVVSSIESALSSNRKVILVGHSFGGAYVAELALRKKLSIAGLVFISSPLSILAIRAQEAQYSKQKEKDKVLAQAAQQWIDNPTEDSFRDWLSAFGPLFFCEANLKKGGELIRKDKVSMETFRNVRASWNPSFQLLEKLKALPIPKLVIVGKEDLFLPTDRVRNKSEAIGAKFVEIQKAGHFVTFDQPEAVCKAIEDSFKGAL